MTVYLVIVLLIVLCVLVWVMEAWLDERRRAERMMERNVLLQQRLQKWQDRSW